MGSGFIAADLTGDGRLELLVPGPTQWALRSLDSTGEWQDISDPWLPQAPLRGLGGSAADYDADGDLDVIVTLDGEPDRLYRNEGDRFVDVTTEAGLDLGPWRTMSASWADVDADGDLDLYLGAFGLDDPGTLWLGDGDGQFIDASERLPDEAVMGFTFTSVFHDIEGDGLPDLFVPNDYPHLGVETALIDNQGDTWVVDLDSGYHPAFEGMGLVRADLDGDGGPDLIESSFREISVMRPLSDPSASQGVRFVRGSANAGLGTTGASKVFGFGIDVGDLDHDGTLELAVGFGFWALDSTDNPFEQPDALLSYDPETGRFEPIAEDHDLGPTRGLLLVDLDADGWLDRVKRTLDGDLIVDLGTCGDGTWITVALDDASSANRRGIGAEIRVLSDPPQTRWIESGSRSMFVGGPPVVHFGLGDLDTVDLEVRWPDGAVQALTAPTRQALVVARDRAR